MTIRMPLAIGLALLLSAPLVAQETKVEEASGEHPAHKELRALRDELVDAFNKKDLDRLLEHVTRDCVLTWQNAEVSRGHKGIREYYERMMTGPNRVVENVRADAEVDELTHLYGHDKDSGLAFGKVEQDFTLTSDMSFHLSNRWTAHLVKDDGKWKVSALHVSANVFDNPVLDLVRKRTAYWSGGIGAGVGLLGGLGLAWLVGRRRRAAV